MISDSLQFIPDVEFSGISRRLQLGGWTITGVKMSSYPNLYMTNYGDPSKDESVFSRVSMVIELKRLGWRIFFNYFIGFFLAAFLCGNLKLNCPIKLNRGVRFCYRGE